MRKPIRLATSLLLLFGCCFTGCGGSGSRSGVTGKVLLDGQPLAGAQIQLLAKGDAAQGMHSGTTDAQGMFSIKEPAGSNNPIRPGTYVVLVSKFSAKGSGADSSGGGMGGMANELPDIYQDRSASPLTVEIKSAETTLPPLELTTKPTAAGGA